MRRRTFLTGLGGAMAAWPLAAGAQPGKARTILWVSTEAQPDPFIDGFREGMREHGYSEGQNLAFSLRYAPGNPGGLRAMLPELLALPADLIVSSGPAIVATRAVTAKPVLFAISSDPVALGIAESLARPGLQYASLGMQALANDHTVLERDGGSLVLAGVTDLSAPRSSHPAPDLSAALEGAPSRTPIILLDHQPRNAPQAAARGVALQLSGHTHGGMIPGLDRLVARANNGFVSGRYQVGGMTLYVNNGTALWPGFALRLGRSSELTRITLRRASPQDGSPAYAPTSSERTLAPATAG